MKRTVPHLRLGDTVTAKVVEHVGADIFIVDFYGDLLRIKNDAKVLMSPGSSVFLTVNGVKPLQFKLSKTKKSHRFSLSV